MVTCESCGKIKGEKEIGTHWICEDCKVELSTDSSDRKADADDRSDQAGTKK